MLLAMSALAASPAGDESRSLPSHPTYVKVTFKVFVTVTGSVEKFEFVGTEPPVSTSLQAALKKSVSATLPRMALTPNKDHGKPIAGWVLVVSDVDLAYLSAPDGT